MNKAICQLFLGYLSVVKRFWFGANSSFKTFVTSSFRSFDLAGRVFLPIGLFSSRTILHTSSTHAITSVGYATKVILQLPLPIIKGVSLGIKTTQAEYEKGIDCKRFLHGRLVMSKGDTSYTTNDLFLKLSQLWKLAGRWKLVSLGPGEVLWIWVYHSRGHAQCLGSWNL